MPLQNRVDPAGAIRADPARGLMMGNRGGRLHDPATRTLRRTAASRRWICCRLDVAGRCRTVMGDGYTELFFLDEPTALAAGHRPCFECRRADARTFARAWPRPAGAPPPAADAMDRVLAAERLRPTRIGTPLPDGTMVSDGAAMFAVRSGRLLPWSFAGYGPSRPLLRDVRVLTPPTTVAVLAAGYRPLWHPSAGQT